MIKLIILLSLTLSTAFANPDNFPISNESKSFINFNKITDKVLKIYKPIFAKEGLNFKINTHWEFDYANATASPRSFFTSGDAYINVFGGIYRTKLMTNDSYMMTLCHEIGHHIGGIPRYSLEEYKHLSVEGQADYYAAHICMPIVLKDEDNLKWSKLNKIDIEIKNDCNKTWGINSERSLICQRSLMAAKSLANALTAMQNLSHFPKYNNKDKSAVTELYENHPESQCRLDTYKAGAFCQTENSNGGYKNSNCSYHQALEIKNIRPQCWMIYPKGIEHLGGLSTNEYSHIYLPEYN